MMVGTVPPELEEAPALEAAPVSGGGVLHPCLLAHHSLRFWPLLRFFCLEEAHHSLEFCWAGIIF